MTSLETPADPTDTSTNETTRPRRRDTRRALQAVVALDVVVRLALWGGALALTTGAFTALDAWPARGPIGADLRQAAAWAWCLAGWVILFNVIYVAELVVVRLLVPTPKEGRYPTGDGARPHRQLLWALLVGLLSKARYFAPFPGFLVFHIANLPPMVWLMRAVFGPKSRSCYFGEPKIIDPSFVEIGRNVIIGINTTIAGHYQTQDAVVIKRTIIEDDMLIGGHAGIAGGVHLKAGCMIGAGAIVLPETVVGPNEFWAGVPAKRIGMVRGADHNDAA